VIGPDRRGDVERRSHQDSDSFSCAIHQWTRVDLSGAAQGRGRAPGARCRMRLDNRRRRSPAQTISSWSTPLVMAFMVDARTW